MDLVKGAAILAQRIAGAEHRHEGQWRRWSREAPAPSDPRCVECGGPVAESLAVLGSLRCGDCAPRGAA
ncbi:MAG TPA: hypothetical protein VF101_08875 [Gaiellaceae bacterium]